MLYLAHSDADNDITSNVVIVAATVVGVAVVVVVGVGVCVCVGSRTSAGGADVGIGEARYVRKRLGRIREEGVRNHRNVVMWSNLASDKNWKSPRRVCRPTKARRLALARARTSG